MAKPRTFEQLWADVQQLQKEFPSKARIELMPVLKERFGWNSDHYSKVFIGDLEFKSFFGY